MKAYVVDTHGLFWHLTKDRRLGQAARAAFAEAEAGQATIFVPAIVLAELYYVNEKVGKPVNFGEKFRELQSSPHFQLVPLEPSHILELEAADLSAITEMHDRLVAATALRLGVELITKDALMTRSKAVPVIW